jgi:hypothetical protein
MFLAVGMMIVVVGGGTLFLWNKAEREGGGETGGDATVREPNLVPEAARERVAVL